MTLFTNKAFRAVACGVLLCATAAGLFSYTVHMRRPWFGTTGTLDAGLATGTLLAARQWYREGMVGVGAGIFRNPRSIEFPTLRSREVNSSYPPGTLLPIHCLSRLAGHEPTTALIAVYNLFTHFAIALLLSMMTFVLLRQMHYDYWSATLLSLIPIVLELLLPAPLYHHQMGFFPEQAVMILFAAYIFIEVLRDSVCDRRWRGLLSILQAAVAFLGILTDWLFALIALCVYLKRVARREFGRGLVCFVKGSVAFWFSFGLAIALFAVQLFALGQGGALWKKFVLRAGMSGRKPLSLHLFIRFWQRHMVRGYGDLGIALLWASLLFFVAVLAYGCVRLLLRRKVNQDTSRVLGVVFMVLAPCFLHALFLRNHCAHPFHYFTALKFSVPLATVPFVLAPVLALSCLGADMRGFSAANLRALVTRRPCSSTPRWSFLPIVLLALTVGYVYAESPRILPQFKRTVPDTGKRAIAEFIAENTQYEDVVFSPHRDLEQTISPLYLAFSMKRVYVASKLKYVYEKLQPIAGDYVVNVLVKAESPSPKDSGMRRLLSRAYDTADGPGVRLYKVRKRDFLALCGELGVGQAQERPAARP